VKQIPRAGETVLGWDFDEPVDGGKGSNQAIAAAKLGARVGFVGCVGRDRVGDEGERWMQNAGVDTTWLKRHERMTSGIGFILLNENGVPAMVTSMGANAELSCADVEMALSQMKSAKILLTQFEIPVEIAIYAARMARECGMISIINPAPAPGQVISGLDAASILVPNETEAHSLLGLADEDMMDPIEMAKLLKARSGAETVLITLGGEGVVGIDVNQQPWRIRAPKVQVEDTSGAGDAFCAALAVGLTHGLTAEKAAEWASYAAALSVTREGTIPSYPVYEEVQQFIASLSIPG
jgi:ribokinase